MRQERPNHTLQPTALVHQALRRLLGCEGARTAEPREFLALAVHQMRLVLIDHGRRVSAGKRGGDSLRVPLDSLGEEPCLELEDLLALDLCLDRLGALDPRALEVVELRFFGGLTGEETAAALGVSATTVARDWEFARAWLRQALDGKSR